MPDLQHASERQSRELDGDVREHVDGIRDDKDDALVVALRYFGDDGFEDGDIFFHEVEARFPRPLVRARRDDGYGGV